MWESKYNENAESIIKELLAHTSSSGVTHSIRIEILLTELISLSSKNLEYWLIIKTLIELKKANRKGIKSFSDLYINELAEFKKLKNKKWTIILPYNNLLLKRRFKVLNEDFIIINQKAFKKIIDQDKVLEAVNKVYKYRTEGFVLPDLFIQFETTGNNLSACWNNIKNKFTILQGVYDYGLSKGIWIQKDCPLTIFSHPEWILGQDYSGKIEFNSFLIYGKPRPLTMGQLKVKRAIGLLNEIKLDVNSSSTKSLIYDCFRIYGLAMESPNNYNCFLGLWQIIENICLSESFGGNTNEVVRRLDIIIKEKEVLDFSIEGLYKSLPYKRNSIVHKNVDETDNRDVNILKLLAETAIEWLIEKEKGLKTKSHINEYFTLYKKYDKDKVVIQETLKYLDKVRRQKANNSI